MPQTTPNKKTSLAPLSSCIKTYEEIIKYLDTNWKPSNHITMQKLNRELGNIAQQFPSIIIAGTNDKNITTHYLKAILNTQLIKTGTLSSLHSSSYNERISINNETISNQSFTDLANQVLYISEQLQIYPSSKDILTCVALLYFYKNSVDVALLEVSDIETQDPVTICSPSILAISQIIPDSSSSLIESINKTINYLSPQSSVICSDPSKISLTMMEKRTKKIGSLWVMPIRKVAPLDYPFEQLFGRCAALAYRTAITFIEKQTIQNQYSIPPFMSKAFWQTIDNEIANTFQLIHYKNKSIILDHSNNLNAYKQLFLGVRLLSYQRPMGKIFFIFAKTQQSFDDEAFFKLFKSYFKKLSGAVSFCTVAGQDSEQTLNQFIPDTLKEFAKLSKIKTIDSLLFKDSLNQLVQEMNHPEDLLIITGSHSIIKEFIALSKRESI